MIADRRDIREVYVSRQFQEQMKIRWQADMQHPPQLLPAAIRGYDRGGGGMIIPPSASPSQGRREGQKPFAGDSVRPAIPHRRWNKNQ